MISAVVTSDNHLGAYSSRLRADRLELRRQTLQAAFERVVDHAIAQRADLFLHAGDLFDRPDPRNAERKFVARQLMRLQNAQIPVVAIAGNHDSPRSFGLEGGIAPLEELAALSALRLFRGIDEMQEQIFQIRGQNVRVRGMSSDWNLPADVCPLEGKPSTRQADIEIALLHYGVEGWQPPFAHEPLLSLQNLDALGADAICVGHLHGSNRKTLPQGALLLNPGATEHIHFGEEHLDCGFWQLGFDGGQTRAEYIKLPTQPMLTLNLDLTGGLNEDEAPGADADLTAKIEAEIARVSRPELLLRVKLKGRVARADFQNLDLPRLQQRAMQDNFMARLDLDELAIHDPTQDIPLAFGMSFDAREELEREAQHLEAAIEDPLERDVTRAALQRIQGAYDRLAA